MYQRNLCVRSAAALLILMSVAACTSRPTTEAVSKFSVALDGASSSVQRGLAEIQRLEVAANDAAVAEKFVREKDPNIQFNQNNKFTDSIIAPRAAFFTALSLYADSLAAAVSDEQIDKVGAQFTNTANAFIELGGKFAETSGANFPKDVDGAIGKAFGELGAFLVEQKLNREIPKIVTGVHDDLVTGVEAFKADLGDPSKVGFRWLLKDTVDNMIDQKKKLLLLLKANQGMSDGALYSAVLQAQKDVRELRKSERLLDAIPPALDKLLSAHEALMNPKDQTTLGKIQIFLERAKELHTIASSLNS